jgi:hypothetical protein
MTIPATGTIQGMNIRSLRWVLVIEKDVGDQRSLFRSRSTLTEAGRLPIALFITVLANVNLWKGSTCDGSLKYEDFRLGC